MGVDLTLIPFEYDGEKINRTDLNMSFTLLSLNRDSSLWDAIGPIEEVFGKPVPENFSTYRARKASDDEDGTASGKLGATPNTGHDERMNYVTAALLLTLRDHEGVRDDSQNRAVWAYLAELRDDEKIALYWD